jgi:hypothetical protein
MLGVRKETARLILEKDLHKRKICSWFVPQSLTQEEREHGASCCQIFIAAIDQDRDVL